MGRGSGFVWGGLLQGLGGGLAAMGQADLEERRRIALESLRHSNALNEAQADAVLKNDLNAKQVERQLSADIVRDGVRTNNDIKLEGVKAASARDLENLRTRNDKDLARLKATLDADNDAASQRLKAELETGQVDDVRVAQDGSYVVFKKNGQVLKTNIKAAQREVTGAGKGSKGLLGDLDVENSDETKPSTPAPAPKPKPNPAPLGNGAGNTRAGGGTVRAPNGNRPPLTSFLRN